MLRNQEFERVYLFIGHGKYAYRQIVLHVFPTESNQLTTQLQQTHVLAQKTLVDNLLHIKRKELLTFVIKPLSAHANACTLDEIAYVLHSTRTVKKLRNWKEFCIALHKLKIVSMLFSSLIKILE